MPFLIPRLPLETALLSAVLLLSGANQSLASPVVVEPGPAGQRGEVVFNFDASALGPYEEVKIFSGFSGNYDSEGTLVATTGPDGSGLEYGFSFPGLLYWGPQEITDSSAPGFLDGTFSFVAVTVTPNLAYEADPFSVDPYAIIFAKAGDPTGTRINPLPEGSGDPDASAIPEPPTFWLVLASLLAAALPRWRHPWTTSGARSKNGRAGLI